MNARGNALLGALATIVGLGVVSSSMVAYYENFTRTSRATFVRSAFTSFEGSVRYMSMQPYAYNCGSMSAISSCTVNPGYFANLGVQDGSPYRLRRAFSGAKCPANIPNCGFLFEFQPNLQIINNGGKDYGLFQAKITYEGEEAAVKPATFPTDPNNIDVLRESVPIEVLQSQVIDCNQSTGGVSPVFAGFLADGRPNCVGFDECPQFSYVSSVNFDTLKVTCNSLNTPDKNLDCSQTGQRQSALTQMNWGVTDGQVTRTCAQMPQAPLNETKANCPATAQEQPNGACYYSNRWCQVGPGGSPTLGFTQGPGAQHDAGCFAGPSAFYPTGAVISDGNGGYLKCMTGPFNQYPLPDSMCPGGAQPPGCPDQVYQDGQMRSSGMQNGFVDMTVDFSPAVNSIPPNCKYDSVTLDVGQFGSYGGPCLSTATFNLTPGGGPGFFGFMGRKTSIVTAVVNGPQAYITDRVAGFGNCGGNPCAACLSNARVTVHSVPK